MTVRVVLAGALALAVAGAALACSEPITDPSTAAAIEVAPLPFPAVVAGDTLRDSTGAVAPLKATAFNGHGDVITGAQVRFLATDTTVRIDPSGILVARPFPEGKTPETTARLVAVVGTLQSQLLSLPVVPSPDSVIQGRVADTVSYALPDSSPANTSHDLDVTLRHRVSATDITAAVKSYLVLYQITYHGSVVPSTDTSVAILVDELGRRSSVDTTGSDGKASRRVRVHASALASRADSVIVSAVVRYRRSQVPGSPVQFVVRLRPR